MIETFLLFAQKTPPGGNMVVQFVPFVLIFVLFWFLIIRPQRKRDKDHQSMVNSLKTGDRVVTRSGMFGEVAEVTAQTVIVEIAPKVKVSMQKQAVTGISAPSTSGKSAKSASAPSSDKEEEFTSPKKKKKRRK